MKDNNIRKVALIAILLLCLPLAAFAAPNTNADDDSYLAQYMTRYDYVLPQTIIEQIQVNFTPQEADCDLIRVRFDEILYDGQWMYTSASVWPQNPDEVIVMPGDVQKNDLVTGPYDEKLQNDMRSFESVAKEDGKQLLCVYAYMKEFDDIGEYFLDHFQKANGESVLMSGARMAGGCKAIKATWSIKVYDVDLETGKYSLLGEYLFPMKILPLQPYAERTYRVVSGEKDLFESVVLAYLKVFLVGGALCAIGELLVLRTRLTPARILVCYSLAGVLLSAVGLYGPLADFAGAGATVPLTGFGHALCQGVMSAVDEIGFIGAFTGGLSATAGGIAAAVFFGTLIALAFKPRAK